jgi:hypothetical protein
MDDQIKQFLESVYGKQCYRQRVGKPRSLWLGFGEKKYHGKKLIDPYYGELEIGTYYCSWRILKGGKILCGSNDLATMEELNAAVQKIEFGQFIAVRQLSDCDVRTEFDSGLVVDFLATTKDDDECFGLLYEPTHVYVQFSIGSGWKMGLSNQSAKPS